MPKASSIRPAVSIHTSLRHTQTQTDTDRLLITLYGIICNVLNVFFYFRHVADVLP